MAEYAKPAREAVRDVATKLAAFRKGEPVHDCVTVATMMDDSIATYKDYYAEVECVSPKTVGRTVIDFWNEMRKPPNVRVALDVDKQKYIEIFKKMMEYYA